VKRLARFLMKAVIILLLLPLMIVYGLFIYGKYMTYAAQQRLDLVDEQQAVATSSGNGFGGDPGMHVIDSRYRSEKYFWIDNDHLVFQTSRKANESLDTRKHFVWDTRRNAIKPLVMEGDISGFYDGRFHYAEFSKTQVLPNGSRKIDRFQSTLTELDDHWDLENIVNMEEVLGAPPERYELAWFEGKPWFRLKPELRTQGDVPRHRFEYLWEWGWILRTPWDGPEHFGQAIPEMGFFDMNGEIYADQPGKKIAGLVDLPPGELIHLVVVYLRFLDRYWLASRFHGGKSGRRFMGLLDRNGQFRALAWPGDWPGYRGIPLPTKKGLFWSGEDYRLANPGRFDKAAFVRGRDGLVHKAVQGSAIRSLVSGDGCRVAFFNTPRPDRGAGSLKYLDVCQSTMDGKELTNVDY